MSKRYEITSDWRVLQSETAASDDWSTGDTLRVSVVRECADIRSLRDGFEYERGAYRIRSTNLITGKSHVRAKTFYGEFAWADSNRLFDDILNDVMYRR